MNAKRRWYELVLPGLAALALLAAGTVETAKAEGEYVENVETSEYETDDYHVWTSTYREFAYTAADASEESGVCSCSAWNITWAKNDIADASARARGVWLIDWTWDGPAEEAPGGTLDWTHYGHGEVYAAGANTLEDPNTESATSLSIGESKTWSVSTEGSAHADIQASGYAEDLDPGDGGVERVAVPWEDYWDDGKDEYSGSGWYSYGIDNWVLDTGDEEDIPQYTTYVYFGGWASCESFAFSAATGAGVESAAVGNGEAAVSLWADFTPND